MVRSKGLFPPLGSCWRNLRAAMRTQLPANLNLVEIEVALRGIKKGVYRRKDAGVQDGAFSRKMNHLVEPE